MNKRPENAVDAILILGETGGWVLVRCRRAGFALAGCKLAEVVVIARRVKVSRAVVVVTQRLMDLRVSRRDRAVAVGRQ